MSFHITTNFLIKEAKKKHIKIKVLDSNAGVAILSKGKIKKFINFKTYSGNSSVASSITINKYVSKLFIKEAGLNTPRCNLINSKFFFNPVKLLKKYNFPFIVKPLKGTFGKDVFIIFSKNEYITKCNYFIKNNIDFIVEDFFKGNDYRFFVIQGEIIGVINRIPANVIGDGKNSIKKLIEIKNKDSRRGNDEEFSPLLKIVVDQTMIDYLKNANFTLESKPIKNQIVYLRANANISTGGDSIDCTDIYHKKYKTICKKMYQILPELQIVGIDILSQDISQDPEKISYTILEINSFPGFDIHMFPYKGKKRNIAKNIINFLFNN